MGRVKAKLGLKGATKPGEMLSRLNSLKHKSNSAVKKTTKYKGVAANPNSPQNYAQTMQGAYSRTYGLPPNSHGDYARVGKMMAKKKSMKKKSVKARK